jgi:NitT/TauT family transport system permease protein
VTTAKAEGRAALAPRAARKDAPDRHPRGVARLRDRALSLVVLLAVWWVVARMAGAAQLLPSPGQVYAFFEQAVQSGELPVNVVITLARVVVAFALAMLAGSVLGFLAGRSPRLDAAIDPWLTIGLNLPVLVVIILAYIWIGLNDVAAVVAVAIAKTPTVVITIREGARAFDPQFDELAAVYRLPLLRRLRRIAVPQLAPYIAAAGRSGLSITWKIVLIVELLGRPNGVGFELNMLFQSFNVTGILAYGLSFAGLMLVVEAALLQPWERRANAWRRHA